MRNGVTNTYLEKEFMSREYTETDVLTREEVGNDNDDDDDVG